MHRAAWIMLAAGAAWALESRAADTGAMRTIAARDYVATATAALLDTLQQSQGRLEAQPRGQHADIEIDAAGPLQLRARPPALQVSSLMAVWVDVLAGPRVVRRVPVRFEVRWFKPALVARYRLHAKAALMADMFEWREMNVAGFRGGIVSSFTELAGKRLRRELDINGVLASEAIEDRPPVEAGERIQVVASVGPVSVQTTAIAQRDGFMGQRIGAKLLHGHETLRVEVVGENKAKVQGDG